MVCSTWTGPQPRLASLALAETPTYLASLALLALLALKILLNATQKVKSRKS